MARFGSPLGDARLGGGRVYFTGHATATATPSAYFGNFKLTFRGNVVAYAEHAGSARTTTSIHSDAHAGATLSGSGSTRGVFAGGAAAQGIVDGVSTGRSFIASHARIETGTDLKLTGIDLDATGGVVASATPDGSAHTSVGITRDSIVVATVTSSGGLDGMHIRTSGSAQMPTLTGGAVLPAPTFAVSNTALVSTIAPPSGPLMDKRDRVEGYIKEPFDTRPDGASDFGTIVTLTAELFRGMSSVRDNILRSRYVDHAIGQSLDNIGAFVFTPRRDGELDAHYRIRVKATFQRLVGGATIDEVRETTAMLLSTGVDEIDLTEPFDKEPAIFEIEVDNRLLENAELDVGDFIKLVYLFKAGGVKVNLTVTGLFRHRSLAQLRRGITDIEHAYDYAGYAGRLSPERASLYSTLYERNRE